jgi:tetratricopeptide (TPR) repeat protein
MFCPAAVLHSKSLFVGPRAVLLAALLLAPAISRAQHENIAVDSKVQTLYAQAKEYEAAGNIPGAIEKYKAILETAPRLGSAYNNLGLLYFRTGAYDQAVDVLERGLKVDPQMATASALLGICLFEMARYADARPRLEAALRLNPKDNDAEKLLANDLVKLGDLESAAAHLRKLSQRNPQDQETWYLLGEVYMQLSQQALTKMNAINPDSELVHEMSGEIMESMKNYDGALFEYKKAADMAPHMRGIHYKLGNVYWTLSQWDAAKEQLQTELVNDPRNCKAHALIGDILIDQKPNFEEGILEEDKALALCPDLTQARVDRGRALLKLNRNEEAVKDLQAAERATPDDASAHFFLAQAYRSLGQPQQAQAEMQIFSKLEESARSATAARARELIENKESSQH